MVVSPSSIVMSTLERALRMCGCSRLMAHEKDMDELRVSRKPDEWKDGSTVVEERLCLRDSDELDCLHATSTQTVRMYHACWVVGGLGVVLPAR